MKWSALSEKKKLVIIPFLSTATLASGWSYEWTTGQKVVGVGNIILISIDHL